MKTIYLGYHYNSVDGQHQNRILKSVEEVNSFLNARASEEYSSDVDNLVASIALMKAGQCKYIDIDHGDWITITKVDVEDAGITDREAIAVINALRVYQAEDNREDIIDDFGLDQDNMTDDEIENLIQRINLGEVEVEYAKPVAINKSLAERIREMAEGMAVANYTSDDNPVPYDDFMSSEDVHEIASIWEPFETDTTENIQSNVENDAHSLVRFAEAIIATVTTSDMLDIIGQRAYDMEDALIEQKAIAKIGDKFEVHFDYYETGELTEHTITRIDFSKTESDEVLYCDDNTHVYITESELRKYKASTHFTIIDENQYCVVAGRYYPDDEDMERFLNEGDACFTGSGKFYIQNDDIGTFYRDRGFDAEFLARSAFCVQAIPIGEAHITFLVHTGVLDSILKNEITTTEQLETLVSLVNDSPILEHGMNVGQLIAELQKLDPDKLVTIVVGNEDGNIVDTKQFELHATENSVEYVEFFVRCAQKA